MYKLVFGLNHSYYLNRRKYEKSFIYIYIFSVYFLEILQHVTGQVKYCWVIAGHIVAIAVYAIEW